MIIEIILTGLLGVLVWVIWYYYFNNEKVIDNKNDKNNSKSKKPKPKPKKKPKKKPPPPKKKHTIKPKHPVDMKPRIEKNQHPELVAVFRGHTGAITGLVWSQTGKYITSTSTDGTIQTWGTCINEEDQWHIRDAIVSEKCADGSHYTCLSSNTDHMMIIAGTQRSKKLVYYQFVKTDGGKLVVKHTSDTKLKDNITQIVMSSDDRYLGIVTGPNKTKILFQTPRGKEICTLNPNQFRNNHLRISDNNRHMFVSTPQFDETKVWKCYNDKNSTNIFDNIQKLTHWKSHNAGIVYSWFMKDDQILYTVSKDGSIKAWDIYNRDFVLKKEKPLLLNELKIKQEIEMIRHYIPNNDIKNIPQGILAITNNKQKDEISFYKLKNGKFISKISNILTNTKDKNRCILKLEFSLNGQYIAVGSNDQDVRVYKVPSIKTKKK